MANVLAPLVPKLLAMGLKTLREQSFMPRIVNRAYSQLAGEKGTTIDVPIASAIVANDVSPSNIPPALADVGPTTVPITMDKWKEAVFYLTDKEILEVMNGIIPLQAQEAIKALVNGVNADIFALYPKFWGFVGTPGTTPFGASVADATNARKVLNKQLAPMGDRSIVLDPDAEANALNLEAISNQSWRQNLNESAIVNGMISRTMGFDWYSHQLVPTHTTGAAASYLVNNGAGLAVGATSAAIDTGSGAWVVGDVITFAGHTQTYVINGSTGGASATAISFQPPLKATVADNAAITKKASHVVNLALHRDAIAFASRPFQDVPNGLGSIVDSVPDPESQIVLRMEITREHRRIKYAYDILYGCAVIRPELGVRIAG